MYRAIVFLVFAASSFAAEADALAILANLKARHLPHGAVLDPLFASATSDQIVGYTRCGDSALWTGHYLAAESFRYKVTQAPDALTNIKGAVAAIQGLVDVTGKNLLARCMIPIDSPYAAGIASEEAANGIYKAPPWLWVGNTSRDQYSGVIFGLSVAYDMVDDGSLKTSIANLATQIIRFLTGNNWSVVMPDGSSSTSFLIRPDQMLTFIQVGRKLNSKQFSDYYDQIQLLDVPTMLAPLQIDALSDSSYFKFNIDYINLYNLIRLEGSGGLPRDTYQKGYSLIRDHTASHQNAFFDVIDHALKGPNAARDTEATTLLDQWLQRGLRDPYIDLSHNVAVCGGQACQPVPVPLRVGTDFLWQRSPFQLSGGSGGLIETAGIDYLLPYWMARYYGVIPSFAVRSAASIAVPLLAPESIASIYGTNLASQTAQAQPPQVTLGGVGLKVTDSAGTACDAALMYVSPTQINFVVPKGTAVGTAQLTLSNGNMVQSATAQVQSVAPTLFSANGSGSGVAAATAIRAQVANPKLQSPVPVFQCSPLACSSTPIDLGTDTPVYVTFYGTGIRGAKNPPIATIHGIAVPVLYAGAQSQFPGLDQVNVALPLDLRGSGESNVVLTVDGQTANIVTINVR